MCISKRPWNSSSTSKKPPRGGFSGEDDKVIDREGEAAEIALYGGVRCCEEELPFN